MLIVENQELILGPPGCGKTHTALELVNGALKQYDPDRIAFVSFTRKATREATSRACDKFRLSESDFPFFRTVHSICFRALRMTKADMMDKAHYKELGEILGYKFEGTFDESETGLPVGDEKGDQLLFLDNYARITCKTLREAWEDADSGLDYYELERLSLTLKEYKQKKLLLDYTDLLSRFVARDTPLPVKFGIVDEAQDLSRLQWKVLKVAFRNCEMVYIAGDDDQSIYKWSGADIATFLALKGKKRVLAQSFRLPKAVHRLASKIIGEVPNRFNKPFKARDSEGSIDRVQNLDYVKINPEETSMFLVRNVFLLTRVEAMLRNQGHPFVTRHGRMSIKKDHVDAIRTWEGLQKGQRFPLKLVQNLYDHMQVGAFLARGAKAKLSTGAKNLVLSQEDLKRDYGLLHYDIWHEALLGIELVARGYYLSILRNGGKITTAPKITVNTIHGVKGGEADHVILLPDMSRRTYEQYQKDPDDERRVAYVAVTRAKEKLSIILPSSQRAFDY